MSRIHDKIKSNPHTKEVIIAKENRGDGTKNDPVRNVLKVYTTDGQLIAENDPHEGGDY